LEQAKPSNHAKKTPEQTTVSVHAGMFDFLTKLNKNLYHVYRARYDLHFTFYSVAERYVVGAQRDPRSHDSRIKSGLFDVAAARLQRTSKKF
jgi:hypothetical protein